MTRIGDERGTNRSIDDQLRHDSKIVGNSTLLKFAKNIKSVYSAKFRVVQPDKISLIFDLG